MIVRCFKCNEPITLTDAQYVILRRSRAPFNCLWGHEQHFMKEDKVDDAPNPIAQFMKGRNTTETADASGDDRQEEDQ